MERPCIVCGEGLEEEDAGGSDGVSVSMRSSGEGGGGSSGDGGGGSGGDGSGGGGKLERCAKPGCAASVHEACRRLLARRVKIWWDGDERWYWGTAEVEAVDAEGECEVHYDDGTRKHERLGKAAGEEDERVEWLVARRRGQAHASVWRSACSCSKGVVVEEGAPRALEDDARSCAVCCISDYRYRSEPGDVNHLIYCDGCGMCVHMFCYGMNAEGPMFGRQAVESLTFLCDVCLHLGPEMVEFGPGGLDRARCSPAAKTARRAHPECSLCPQRGGALRLQRDGSWAHVSCVLYGAFEWKSQPGHSATRLCNRQSRCENCLKHTFRSGITRQGVLAKVKARNWCCTVVGCPDRTQVRGLVICGAGAGGPGCKHAAHVSCAQRPGSGWHIMLKEIDSSSSDGATVAEITCEDCSDLFLDVSGPKPVYKHIFPQLTTGAVQYVGDEEYAAADFTFMDWAHGPCFGFTRVGHRAGGVCVGACDSDEGARMQYMATFGNANEPLECILGGLEPWACRAPLTSPLSSPRLNVKGTYRLHQGRAVTQVKLPTQRLPTP